MAQPQRLSNALCFALSQSDETRAIRSLTAKDDDGQPLYWSNEWGWGSGDSCQLFTGQDHVECNLPIGGEWEKW